MSGGIKYRLSPRERTLVADQLGVLDSVRDRVKGSGLDLRIQDQEMEISVEEKGEELSYELSYPLDNDAIPGNGRIYVKDVFRLNRRDGKLLGFDRNASQKPGINEKVRYWIEVARRDHSQAKINDNSEHLAKFIEDLSALPKPALKSGPLKTVLNETLPGLHRPFPDNSKALFEANFEVFTPIRDSVEKLGLRMKFRDPQSGLTLRREGKKLILGLQLVLDTDADPGIDSENNGRIYLNDIYEIDAASGKVLSAKRSFTPSKVPSSTFDAANERLEKLGPLQADSEALGRLTRGWLEGLGAMEPATPPTESGPAEPADAYGKALWRWYQRTGDAPSAADLFLPPKPSVKFPTGSAVPEDKDRRQALRRCLGAMLAGDVEGTSQESAAWKTDPIFQSLVFLSRQESTAAENAISTLSSDDELAKQVRRLVVLQKRTKRLDEAFPLLESALSEMTQRQNNEDRAWVKGLGRAFSGDSPTNPEMRRIAIDGYLRRLRGSLEAGNLGITAAIQGLEGDGPFEKEIKGLLNGTPALRELTQALDEGDEDLRQESLVHLARRSLQEPNMLPATALAIAQRYAEVNPKAAALQDWMSGKASFGQKFESSLGHFNQEIANPFTLGTMMLAGGASKIGKLAFVKYFGNTSLALQVGAEAFSVGLESAVFVGSDKLYRSAFQTPVGVWGKAPADFAGAMLAFGILRGGGIAGRRFQGSLRNSEAWQTWLEGRTKLAWVEKPLEIAVGLGKAEGRAAAIKQQAGNLLAKPLRYLNETGLSRTWLKPTADFAVHHGLTLTSLMLGNSLSRFAGLRQGSVQGWKADLVDDALLYGHFYFSGQLMQRMGPSQLDYRMAALESGGPQIGRLRAKQSSEATESAPESKPESPRFEFPPALNEFRRLAVARFAKFRQSLRGPSEAKDGANPEAAAPSSSRFAWLRPWLQSWREGLAGLRFPWNKPKGVPVPPPTQNPLMLPPGSAETTPLRPTRPSWTETLPPQAELSNVEVFLIPKPLELPLRFVPTKAKSHLAVSWTGTHDNRAVLPVSKNTVTYECILGREEIQARPEATGADYGFPSTAKDVEAQHAKISYQVKLKLKAMPDAHNVMITIGVPDKITATVENLAKSSATYVNGKRVKSATLHDGDRVQFGKAGPAFIFHQETPEQTPSFTQGIVPLAADQPILTVGRESQKHGSPDIAFPMSSRDISVQQARFLRDAEGNHYLQDMGKNLTLVNGMPVYGTQMLQNRDVIRFGEGQEFIFRRPTIDENQDTPTKVSPRPHPNVENPEPPQADLHSSLRGMSPEEVQGYYNKLAELDRLPLEDVRAASLETPDGRPILMMTRYTGWSVGQAVESPTTTQLQFRESGKAEANPFLIYMAQDGDFVLKPLKPDAQISVQPRLTRFWHPKAPEPQGPRINVEGWVKLRGGERIFSGDQSHFDFWIFSPARPAFELPPVTGEIPKEPVVIESAKPAGPPLLTAGAIPLQVRRSLVIQSEGKLETLQIEPVGEDVSVRIPASAANFGRTTVFHEGDSWKIRTESPSEVPVLVNDIPLPAGISLPISTGSELSIGGHQFRLEFPH